MEKEQNKQAKYDYSPLAEEISWARSMQNVPRQLLKSSIPAKILLIIALLYIILMIAISIYQISSSTINLFSFIALMYPLIVIFLVTAITVYSSNNSLKNYRKQKFAEKNNFSYVSNQLKPNYSGVIFNKGTKGEIVEAYILNDQQNAEIGNFTYSTGNSESDSTYIFGYIKMTLPRKLPHMLIDAGGNNGVANTTTLPLKYRSNQKLMLEGDFNNYFTLYAPEGYEQDALYVLTPNIMQILVTKFKDYDIEIVDDILFIYSTKFFALDSSQQLANLFAITDTLYSAIYKQSDNYNDDNVAQRNQNIIAEAGSRLKNTSISNSTAVIIMGLLIITLLFWFLLPAQRVLIPSYIAGIIFIGYSIYRILK